MSMLTKLKRAITHPDAVLPYLRAQNEQLFWHLSNRRILPVLLAPISAITNIDGKKVYCNYLEKHRGIEVVESDINNNIMRLYPSNPGIDQELLWSDGTREYLSTKRYRKLLEDISETEDDILVLDIGANIGYFVLLAADIIRRPGVIAFEPSESNYDRLVSNIEANNYEKFVRTVDKGAGESTDNKELVIDSKTTLHNIATGEADDARTTEIEVVAIDDFITDAKDVVIVRMDIQGYEYQALTGMRDLLESNRKIILFLEIHLDMLGEEEHNKIIKLLDENDFNIDFVCGHSGIRPIRTSSFADLKRIKGNYHLFVSKDSSGTSS